MILFIAITLLVYCAWDLFSNRKLRELDVIEIGSAFIRCLKRGEMAQEIKSIKDKSYHIGKAIAYAFVLEKINVARKVFDGDFIQKNEVAVFPSKIIFTDLYPPFLWAIKKRWYEIILEDIEEEFGELLRKDIEKLMKLKPIPKVPNIKIRKRVSKGITKKDKEMLSKINKNLDKMELPPKGKKK